MKKTIIILAAAALATIFAGCSKTEPEQVSPAFDLSDYEFVIEATAGPATRISSSGTWEDGDAIFIVIDGAPTNAYKLQYDAPSGKFFIYNMAGASNAGFGSSGTVAGLHTSSASLSVSGGTFQGRVNGDVLYTTSGSYTKSGSTITITMALNQRPVSLVKITGVDSGCYIENMKTNYTSLTSLATMSFDTASTDASYVYDASSKTVFCYGVLPDDGILHLRYASGDRKVFYRNIAAPGLASSEMTTIAGPETAPAEWVETIDFDHYNTGDAIRYMTSSKSSPINLVITGDGFTVYDMKLGGAFYERARYAVDELFKVEPYKTYKSYFNVYFIPAISKQRGADIGNTNTEKDTYFDTGWVSSSSYSDMVSNSGYSIIKSFVRSNTPGYNASRTFCVVLCNEYTYGALCYWKDSPVICLASVCLNSSWTAPRAVGWGGSWDGNALAGKCWGDFSNLVIHEIGGHGIARLADEYPSHTFSTYEVNYDHTSNYSRNLSSSSTSTPWSDFKAAITADGGYVTTDKLGLGEYLCNNNVYRSDYQGTMDDNRKIFGVWNRYLIAERIHSLAGESYSYATFISEVPKTVYDPVWQATRSASPAIEIDWSELTEVPMPAPPKD